MTVLASLVADIELGIQNLITERDLLIAQIDNLNKVHELLTNTSTSANLVPSGKFKTTKFKTVPCGYQAMTARNAMRAYFLTNGNAPICKRKLSKNIDKGESTVRQYLSMYPEFISVGGGNWILDPSFHAKGWCIVGK